VRENDEIYGMKVLELPGHTRGLVGLLIDNKMLVSDAVKNRVELDKGVSMDSLNEESRNNSIEKVKKFATVIYPGHDVPLRKKDGTWIPITTYEEKIHLNSGITSSEGKHAIT